MRIFVAKQEPGVPLVGTIDKKVLSIIDQFISLQMHPYSSLI